MICGSKSANNVHGELLSKCQPYYPESDSDMPAAPDRLSPSAVLYDLLENGNSDEKVSSKTIARLLGSIMMNGLPLLGLDDFLRTSDYVNQNLNTAARNDIMESPFLNGQFGTLLRARDMQISISPENCWSKGFVKYMKKSSTMFTKLKVKSFKSMYKATNNKHCCENVWVIIEIVSKNNICPKDIDWDEMAPENVPSVTLRFHPSSVPDSRNVLWSARKQGGKASRMQAGQLLYFTSGFLTMQLEVQNYLSSMGIGGPPIHSQAFSSSTLSFSGLTASLQPDQMTLSQRIADDILSATSTSQLISKIYNTTSLLSAPRPVLHVPVYDRAYPTRGYAMDKFWHKLAVMVSIVLIVYFSLPAAVVAGYFCREASGGIFDSLFSIPGVDIRSCTAAWTLSCCVLMLGPLITTYIYFMLVLDYTSAYIPSICCFLMGICMGPISIIISTAVKKAEAAVIVVPTVVFLTMLPGMLYYDLAFDVQRSFSVEALLCLLPPSAAVMVVRLLCTMEALHSPLTWSTAAIISNTPLHFYGAMLAFDFVLYFAIAEIVTWAEFRPQKRSYITTTHLPLQSSPALGEQLSSNSWFTVAVLGIPLHFGRLRFADDHTHALNTASSESEPVPDFPSQPRVLPMESPDNVGLRVSGLHKSYEAFNGNEIEVLVDVNADLVVGSVTSLLGSNGAGKTTFMRILGGFDTNYTGTVQYANPLRRRSRRQRVVGWCAQTDSLFDFLTVREHLELYARLLGNMRDTGDDSSNPIDSSTITSTLASLDLLDHAHKYAHHLSGGMKRRLSLAIACLGDPKVLLLDEPTSGCDAWTRELVRKDILARKDRCAVLISTHHVDDVEIISDRVWFLNEHSLIFNGALSDLQASRHGTVLQSDKASAVFMEFSTSNIEVRSLFGEWFAEDQRRNKSSVIEIGTLYSCSVEATTCRARSRLREFVALLEKKKYHDWSLVSPNAYKALSKLYDITEKSYSSSILNVDGDTVTSYSSASFPHEELNTRCAQYSALYQIRALLNLRVIDIKSTWTTLVLSHILLPFLIILILVFACGDVRFPKLELGSVSIDGVGDVLVGYGGNRSGLVDSDILINGLAPIPRVSHRHPSDNKIYFGEKAVKGFMGNAVTWVGDISSDELFSQLYDEYFSHPDRPRWASFVIDDTVERWLQSSVRITQNAMRMPAVDAFKGLQAIQAVICNQTYHGDNTTEKLFKDSTARAAAEYLELSIPHHQLSGLNDTNRIAFCSQLSAVEIDIVNHLNASTDGNLSKTDDDLVITAFQALHSNLTMMTNVTTDHGAPIFMKEVAPYIYGCLSLGYDAGNVTSFGLQEARSKYRLYSYPFDDANTSSPMYLQRGYMGAMMTILYILMTSTIVVKFITYSKSSGVKTQIHLSGTSVSLYWLVNFFADTMLLCFPLLSIYFAIWIGGPPIRNFFFDCQPYPGFVFLVALLAYASSSVAANFAFAAVSTDQISSQLISLVTTICGGLFMKLFLMLHGNEFPYKQIGFVLTWISPSFALSSCLFEMFSAYVRQVGKTVGILGGASSNWSAISDPIVAMLVQSLVYLIITILLDICWYQMSCTCQRLVCGVTDRMLWCFKRVNGQLSDGNTSLRQIIDHYISLASPRQAISPEEKILLLSDTARTQRTLSYGSQNRSQLCDDNAGVQADQSSRSSSADSLDFCGSRIHSMLIESSVFREEFGIFPDLESWMMPPVVPPPLLLAQGLSVSYSNCDSPILKDLDMNMQQGERIALMGINGGGKSTLFKSLSTSQMFPVGGDLSVCGLNTVSDHWTIAKCGAVGYVPQEGGLLEFMTVQEAIDLFAGLRATTSSSLDQADAYKQFYSILPHKYFSYTIKSLSGGNKRKLAVVLSNINSPALLLLDEPSSGVDPAAAERIVQYLCDLPTRQGLLFASHRLDECLRVCERALMLLDGRKQFDGSMAALDSVADLFYQVDVYILIDQESTRPHMETFLDIFIGYLNCHITTERIVVYSPSLVRLTLEKAVAPYSETWGALDRLQGDNIVGKYAFRRMDMEEIFSILVSSSKKQKLMDGCHTVDSLQGQDNDH